MMGGQRPGASGRATRFEVLCDACERPAPGRPYAARCPACGGALGFRYPEAGAAAFAAPVRRMWDYAAWLPVERPSEAVTLDEGGTPLIRGCGEWGLATGNLWIKDESRNPTGSHKDRALSVAISRGRELGFASCVIISAGSTGLSTAAYAARAGMRCALIAPKGTPDERLIPAVLYGAHLFEAPGTFEDALRAVEQFSAAHPVYLTSTYRKGNPYQAEGARTIGFEIAAQLAAAGAAADWIVVPTGGGGTVAGIWRAYGELRNALGRAGRPEPPLPKLAAVQPAPYNALEVALLRDLRTEAQLYALGISEDVPTVQAKLQHGVPPDAEYALDALRASGGAAISVTDDEALAAQRQLATSEGIFGEPSAAAALAGVRKLAARGVFRPHETVVALVTGSGYREVATTALHVPVTRIALSAETLRPYSRS
jgi:threonine synthase